MKKLLLIFLLLCSPVFADNTITDYSEKSLPILNDTFRSLNGRIGVLESAFSGGSTLGIAYGGTGQTTSQTALDALFGTSVQGDVPYYNGSHWLHLGYGTSGQFLKTQGAGANPIWSNVSSVPPTLPSNVAILTDTVSHSVVNTTYDPYVKIAIGVAGDYIVSYTLTGADGGNYQKAQLYKNGVAVGTEHTTTTTQTFTDSITGLVAGDEIEIYSRRQYSSGNPQSIDGAKFSYANVPTAAGNFVPTFGTAATVILGNVYTGSGIPASYLGLQGDIFLRTDGGATTTLYVKTGATTWTAK
jgi:hypothetical protein